jgi:hypothetical protein
MAPAEWLLLKLAALRIGEAWLLPSAREGALRGVPHEMLFREALRIGAAKLNQAWLEGALPLRGVKHGTDEEIDVPSSAVNRFGLDCSGSRLGCPNGRGGWRLIEYRRVKARLADVERLALETRTPIPQPSRAGSRRTHAGAVFREGFTAPGRRTQSRIDLGRIDTASAGAAAPARQEEATPRAAANTPISEAPFEQPQQGASEADILEAKESQFVKEVALELRRLCPGGRPRGVREVILRDLSKRSRLGFGRTTMDRAFKLLGWTRRRAKARRT